MNIVFMGTPDFAACVLKALVEAGHNILAVYTQPDKPRGRSGAMVASEVKEYALSVNLPVYQPEKIKNPEEVELLRTFPADVFVVAAYGQFLSKEILEMARLGCVNVHGSLLPKLRGAAPIQRSIMNGDSETGVTIMQMDVGMDSGDILSVGKLPIGPEDNEITMYEKLAKLGAKLLVETLPKLSAGEITPVSQNPDEVTFAKMLRKEEGLIDFSDSAKLIDCKVRGMLVWPTAYTYYGGKLLKIYATAPDCFVQGVPDEIKPGEAFVTKKNLYVMTGSGLLELKEVQPEGKKRMPGADFARGTHLETFAKFGL